MKKILKRITLKKKLTVQEFNFYSLLMNLIFMVMVVISIGQIFNANVIRDRIHSENTNRLIRKSSQAKLFGVTNSMNLELEMLNKAIEKNIAQLYDVEEFPNVIKNDKETLHNIIHENIENTIFDKNNIIVGTREEIIYNGTTDNFNVVSWTQLFGNNTLNELFRGNIERLFVEANETGIKIISEDEVIDALTIDPQKLKSYYIILPSRITRNGDIQGNNDIIFNEYNKISPYKLLILYKENIFDLYYYNSLSFDLLVGDFDSELYREYLIVFGVVCIWMIYLVLIDKNSKFKSKIIEKK